MRAEIKKTFLFNIITRFSMS